MTFRREMEEMSKKTKRLEKENANLSKKHDATNAGVLRMADDREKMVKELELLRKKNENLEKLCRGMQAQGRGGAVMQQAQQQARLHQQQQAAATQGSQQQPRRAMSTSQIPNGQAVARNSALPLGNEYDEEGTESDYEYDDDELDGDSDPVEFEDDTEEDADDQAMIQQYAGTNLGTRSSSKLPEGQRALPTYGPAPPPPGVPPNSTSKATNGKAGVAAAPPQGVGGVRKGKEVAVNGGDY